MNSFPLKIVTPDGIQFDGMAQELIVRTTTGDLGIMAGHMACVAPLGMGRAMVLAEDKKRYAACMGGMLSMVNGSAILVPTTFEWADKIDVERVATSETKAKAILQDKKATQTEIRMAEARLKRALVRKSVSQFK